MGESKTSFYEEKCLNKPYINELFRQTAILNQLDNVRNKLLDDIGSYVGEYVEYDERIIDISVEDGYKGNNYIYFQIKGKKGNSVVELNIFTNAIVHNNFR